MPALNPTDYIGTISWLGVMTHRDRIEIDTEPRNSLTIGWDGVPDGTHSGRNRPSDSRVRGQHALETEIANVRQISIISQEELDLIAADMGLDAVDPLWLGANIVVKGLPDFSHLPPSSRLQAKNGTTFIVDMQNYPCTQVSRTIAETHPVKGKTFKMHAVGRRGVTASVERPGSVQIGNTLRLHVPEQRAWQPE